MINSFVFHIVFKVLFGRGAVLIQKLSISAISVAVC